MWNEKIYLQLMIAILDAFTGVTGVNPVVVVEWFNPVVVEGVTEVNPAVVFEWFNPVVVVGVTRINSVVVAIAGVKPFVGSVSNPVVVVGSIAEIGKNN